MDELQENMKNMDELEENKIIIQESVYNQVEKMSLGKVGIGIDLQLIKELPTENTVFIEKNYTLQEQEYCYSSADPKASFAGKWAAKEAVIKCLSNTADHYGIKEPLWEKGQGASLKEIEIIRIPGHSPRVQFHSEALPIFQKSNANDIKLSISHSGEYSIAIALAFGE
jgi:fatty acid synthase subunit alpha